MELLLEIFRELGWFVRNPNRDPHWVAIEAAAVGLQAATAGTTLAVRAGRHRSLLRWCVVEQLEVFDEWTNVSEPIRSRRLLRSRWKWAQPTEQAVAAVSDFLRRHP